MTEWIQSNETAVWWLAAASLITFVGTLTVVPWLVVRIPPDYFLSSERNPVPWADRQPAVRVLLLLAKNLLGYVFVLMGIAMLVLPGQGILTIVVGVMLLNFPGKYKLERRVVRFRPVLRSINWLRRRAKRRPLVLDD